MRSFGAMPFERSSFNCSVTYCSGFSFVANVAVSDILSLLVVGIGWEESLLCSSVGLGANVGIKWRGGSSFSARLRWDTAESSLANLPAAWQKRLRTSRAALAARRAAPDSAGRL